MRPRILGGLFVVALLLVFLGTLLLPQRNRTKAVDPLPVAGPPPSAASPRTLPPSREELWARPVEEPTFAQFAEWTRRYATATPQAGAAMEAEGVRLARARLAAMAEQIQSNPQRALELAVPQSVRERMPDAVKALLEQPVNATGDLEVLAFRPVPGNEAGLAPVLRYAVIDGERHQAFTYGRGVRFVTKSGVPLNGIRVPAAASPAPPTANGLEPAPFLMALSESPARVLDATELAYLKESRRRARQPEPVCSVSGRPWTVNAEETAVQLAGNITTFCGRVHAEDWAAQWVAGSGIEGGAFFVPASQGTAASSYTEGRKRMLCLRPYWTNQAVAMSTNAALTHFANFSNYMIQLSYGKLVFAPLRQGSDISPEILMPGSVTSYSAGLGSIFTAIKNVARTNYGMDSADYDFVYYVTGSRPAASYAGLGNVGGVGFHLANGYFDAATAGHEFGHNLGLNHANFWQTTPRTLIGAGSSVEYGDGDDPMGGGGNPNQYNSRYKNYLGWIHDSDIANLNALGSGTYRLYCFDLDTSSGLRGLKFARNANQNYWVQFRQRKPGTALPNGVQLLWTGNGNESSIMLDVRQTGNSSDNAIVIGRTFSDPAVGLHVTPVGKGHTYPESIDVVVNTGTFPANQPPFCVLSASATNVAVGQAITFSANATDANGDPLAYYWSFDDDTITYENSPTTVHAFPSIGQYTVQCTVSDMKGGVGRDSIVVRVGNPTTFRISGRVFNGQNRPLSGIKVSANTELAYTDSDGAYTFASLPAGSYTLSALEPLTGATLFIHPFFSNPVTVGPNATNRDFIVGTPAPPLTILPTGSTWKYLDNGSDQGTAWIATNFNDSTWLSGPAQLGYGEGDEATVVGFGPNPSFKFVTTYFRRVFTVANSALYTNLSVNVLRDDGAVVYLNEVEVFRSNMPGGAIRSTNLASASVDSQNFFSGPVNTSLLRTGTNVLAVELHQANFDTSDASFDLSFTAESATNVVQANLVYLTGPENGALFTTPANVTLTANAIITVGAFTNVEFFDGAVKVGEDDSAPFSILLSDPSVGGHLLAAVATTSGGIRRTSPPVVITISEPVQAPVSIALVPAGSTWRYMSTNVAQPASWLTPAFNDSSWSSGAAELGFGDGGEATTIYGGPAASRYPTVYFRRTFSVNDPGGVTNLSLQLKRDDGAVVYLNGHELFRDNMPAGTIAYSTLASIGAADDGAAFFNFNINPALLQPGTNYLAVEVHQSAPDSSDLSFDLSLTALVSTNRTRGCWLVAPADGETIPLPGSVTLSAQTVVGGTLGLSRIDYYSDGALVGTATVPPFAFAWPAAPPGDHELTAIATDTAGGTVASESVFVELLQPPLGTALISFGDMWKYMDQGDDLGSAWTAPGYNDRGWPSGPARLGYGGDGELTTVSYGPSATAKHITTYFRKTFSVANPEALTGLFLQIARDDGAVVYLNGAEVFRDNLQDGPVNWNSLAIAAVDGTPERTPLDVLLSTAGLVAGPNVLAVEIHQNSIGSSDLGFDLALTGLAATNTASGIFLSSPANGTHYNSPASVALSAVAVPSSSIVLVEYFAGSSNIGQSAVSPFNVTWGNPPVGQHTITARATIGAGVITSPPISITVGYPPPPTAPVLLTFIPAGASWNYWDNAAAVGSGWQGTGFNASAWPAAPARFGFGLDGEATPLTEGRVSYYFRRWFNVVNPFVLSELVFQLQRDDGAVVYLNGVEVYRSNMPAGAIGSSTLASTTVNTPDETTFFETVAPLAGLNLVTGSNLVAVEVHQATATSSDAGFNLQLLGVGTTGPRVYFTSPVAGSSFLSTATVAFDGTAYAGAGQSLAKVELFADGVKLGETNGSPFHFTWVMPGVGPHTMLARMTDGRGYTVDSSPLTVHSVRQAITTTFIPSNSVWRYLSTNVSQGTGWVAPAYNDGFWPIGQARLGAEDGATTTINIGPVGARYPTIYFRKSFVVSPGAIYTNLLFKLTRDDGAVVHLNGLEAYRDNMPAGTITYATPAATSAIDELTYFPTNIPISNLPEGVNVVAVEVHQINATSTDLGFNLELTASGYLDETSKPLISIGVADGLIEISWPATYTNWRVYTASSLVLPIEQWTPVTVTPVVAGGRIVVSLPPSDMTQFFRLGRP
jgi:hypothetical protein